MSYDPCYRQVPAIHYSEATEPRVVKVVQHHAYRRRPEREFFFIGGSRNQLPVVDSVSAA